MSDLSFDESKGIDLTSVIGEFPFGDDNPGKMIPIKKLSEEFDSCVKSDDVMKVFLRIRPIKPSLESTIAIESSRSISTTAPDTSKRAQYTKTETRNYIFSEVFTPDCNQGEVYASSAAPLLKRLYEGENSVVLFAYGMTNAGKTYTIQGSHTNAGILPRLIEDILSNGNAEGWTCDLYISMLEIYQEKIYDLLSSKREKLSIRDGNGKVEIAKLSYHRIGSTVEAFKLMDIASERRSKSTTCLNTVSSRSHAVYTVTIERLKTSTGEKAVSSFYLVDLAGAERSNRTNATQMQRQEANSINVSLMKLWRCLQGMRKSKASMEYGNADIIPFRESKLTHLLMPILGSRTNLGGVSMITCVNPQVDDYDETLSILGNASLATKIREVSDLGRTAGHYIPLSIASMDDRGSSTVDGMGDTAPGVVRSISLDALKEVKDKRSTQQQAMAAVAAAAAVAAIRANKQHKRKRTESGNLSKAASQANMYSSSASSSYSTRSGVTNHVRIRSTGTLSSQLSEKDIEEVNSISGSTSHTNTSSNGAANIASATRMGLLIAENKALREHVELLVAAQITKETEIRSEVAHELALRSGDLLDQIQDLQEQLTVYECVKVDNLQKSGKKARKKQRTDMQMEQADDMEELEDELERVKSKRDSEIIKLKEDKAVLEGELEKLRENQKQSQPSELSKRFKTIKTNKTIMFEGDKSAVALTSATIAGAANVASSGKRSPLALITNAIKLSTSPKVKGSGKDHTKGISPKTTGTTNKYFSRLRSQLAK